VSGFGRARRARGLGGATLAAVIALVVPGAAAAGPLEDLDARGSLVAPTATQKALAGRIAWALAADTCSRTRQDVALLRIDARGEEVVDRIPLDVSRGGRRAEHVSELVAGEGALWVATNFSPTMGEVVRIDPVTNELSAPLLDRELLHLGASLIPPVLAAGEDALWVAAQEIEVPYRPVAVRVDAHDNDVTRRWLSLKHFFPLVETGAGVWFIGAGLSRLDPRSLEVAESVALDVSVGDAAFDSATGTLWIAALTLRSEDRGTVVPVDLR
jgi:hypothetical protein